MNSSLWFYSDTLQTYGPVAVHQLTAMIQAGQITAAHYIMPEGGQEWQSVGTSPFAGYLPMAPVAHAAPAPAAFTSANLPPPQPKPHTGPAKAAMRPAGQPGPRQPVAKAPVAVSPSSGSKWPMIAAALLAVGTAGWWFTRPAPVLERKTTKRIEGEAMEVIKVTGGEVAPQGMSQFPTGRWSGNSQLQWYDGAKKYVLQLGFKVDAAESGKQRLLAVLTGARDYAVVKVSVDGKTVPGSPFNMLRQEVVTSDVLDWGIHDLTAGAHVLQFEIQDSMAAAPEDRARFMVGLDYIQLQPPMPSPAATVLAEKAPSTASPAQAVPPIELRPSQSKGGRAYIGFVNRLSEEVDYQWVDFGGKLSKYGTLKPGAEGGSFSFVGHVWLVTTTKAGTHLGMVEAGDGKNTVTIDSQGVHLHTQPEPRMATTPQQPAAITELRPSRDDGDPSQIRFINKHAEELNIQLVDSQGKLARGRSLQAGRTNHRWTSIGQVWLISTKSGIRLGTVESLTENSTVTIDASGVKVTADTVPTRESLELVSMIQLTEANLGDAVSLLRQRVAEAGLNARIELDPRVNAKAGSLTFDATVMKLEGVLNNCAYGCGARLEHQGSTYRIIPR